MLTGALVTVGGFIAMAAATAAVLGMIVGAAFDCGTFGKGKVMMVEPGIVTPDGREIVSGIVGAVGSVGPE